MFTVIYIYIYIYILILIVYIFLVNKVTELESDLQDTVDWGSKWLGDFNTEKTQLVWFDWFDNTVAIDVKMDGSVLGKKSSFKMLGINFFF